MAKQNNNMNMPAVNDVYTAILALAWLTVFATAIYVALVCWNYYGNEMWSFAAQAVK
ncbi:MAG TPA: hypothetical protein P5033_02295 [Anaerohalosphaeraceae bacterium]|jgi:hypothetical protein|nr:hypothetical protein [Anaerohalosphaeraceae bacterium]HRU14834.1 hypothetical protein [Anaerohalosphaeraceae bacterium]